MVAAGALAAVLIVLWGFVWMPLVDASEELRRTVAEKQRLLVDLERVAALRDEASAAPRAGDSQSLVVLVDRTAQSHELASTFTRTRPDGPNEIRVSFQNAPFDGIVSWLIVLEGEYGVSVESASFNGTRERGLVSGQLLLRRS